MYVYTRVCISVFYFYLCCFEARSHYVAHADLELTIITQTGLEFMANLLLHPLEGWAYRQELTHQAIFLYALRNCYKHLSSFWMRSHQNS